LKRKRVNEGLRSLSKNFVEEKELEENIKSQITKEINNHRKK